MKIKMTWKSASNYGKEYDVELLGHRKAYYKKVFDWQQSDSFMCDEIQIRFDNGWQISTELWKWEILEATPEEQEMLDNPVISRW